MGDTKTVTVDLSVRVSDDGAIDASLTFSNTGNTELLLDKRNACLSGKIENDVFKIASDDVPVPYTGALAKRRAPTAEDFAALVPGKAMTTAVRLRSAYAFPPGAKTYSAMYKAFHQYPNKPGFWVLQSNEVTFATK